MKKTSLCIFFFVTCSIAQPQWRQVYKTDSAVALNSLTINRPQEKISSDVIFTLIRDHHSEGPTVVLYNPSLQTIDTIGNNHVQNAYCARTLYNFYYSNYTHWISIAPYDTSREITESENYSSADMFDCGPDCADNFSKKIIQTTIDSECPIYSYCNGEYYLWHFIYPLQSIFFHPTDGTILFGITDSGLVETHFAGCPGDLPTWQIIKRDSAPNFFYIAQDDPNVMFLNAQDTLWRSSDGGASWNVSTLAIVNSIVHVPRTNIYAAASSDSLTHGLYISTDNGKRLLRANATPTFSLDADQTIGTIYAGAKGAILQSKDSGQTITVFDSIPGNSIVIGIAAIDGKIIYADSEGVYETDAPSAVNEPVTPDQQITIENYPNPFSSTTLLKLSESERLSSVKIYNMLGREVADITKQASGREILFDGSGLPAGIYVCTAQSGKIVSRIIMHIVK